MGIENQSSQNSASQDSVSSVGQTANISRSTSVSSGAAKIFREFKWGLLTLFLLMVVVIGLVYDGGRKKKSADVDKAPKDASPDIALDSGFEASPPPVGPVASGPNTAVNGVPAPGSNVPVIDSVIPPAAPVGHTANSNNTVPLPVQPPQIPPQVAPGIPSTPSLTPPVPANPVAPKEHSGSGVMASSDRSYTVKPGDTLTKIANSMLPGKGGVKAILDANKSAIPDPNRLRVGTTLKIPAASVTSAEARVASSDKSEKNAKSEKASKAEVKTEGGKVAQKETKAETQQEYVVQSGDTLERIARKVFNDGRKWHELYEWNRDQLSDPSHLRVGQSLKLKQSGATAAVPQVPAESRAEADIKEPAESAAGPERDPVILNATSSLP